MKTLLMLTLLANPMTAQLRSGFTNQKPEGAGESIMRIACGSTNGGIDPATGLLWQPDQYFSGGAPYSRAETMGALNQPFKALRNGTNFHYTIPLPLPSDQNGGQNQYIVKLYFMEVRTAASTPPIGPGQRKINSTIQVPGLNMIATGGLDLFAAVGSLMPYTVAFEVPVNSGQIIISVGSDPTSLAALISGIEIFTKAPPPPLPTAPYFEGSSLTPPVCPATGLSFFYASDINWLYWCWSGSIWHTVGDVKNGPEPLPQLLGLEACQGSGTGVPPGLPWDCAGLYRATIKRIDGSTMPLVGSSFDVPATSPAAWITIK